MHDFLFRGGSGLASSTGRMAYAVLWCGWGVQGLGGCWAPVTAVSSPTNRSVTRIKLFQGCIVWRCTPFFISDHWHLSTPNSNLHQLWPESLSWRSEVTEKRQAEPGSSQTQPTWKAASALGAVHSSTRNSTCDCGSGQADCDEADGWWSPSRVLGADGTWVPSHSIVRAGLRREPGPDETACASPERRARARTPERMEESDRPETAPGVTRAGAEELVWVATEEKTTAA